MALIKADRVKETSTSTGTGNFTLAGAATGFRTFASVCAVNDTVFYVIDSDSGSEWETGLGTYSAANTLTRTTVHASSNSGSLVPFSAGTKNVYISLTANQINPATSTGANSIVVRNNGGEIASGTWNAGQVAITQAASTTSNPICLSATAGAHTFSGSTGSPAYFFNGSATITAGSNYSTSYGTLATFQIVPRTYALSSGFQLIPELTTLHVTGFPAIGANTNCQSFVVAKFEGAGSGNSNVVWISASSLGYGMRCIGGVQIVPAASSSSGPPTVLGVYPPAHTGLDAEYIEFRFGSTRTIRFTTTPIATQRAILFNPQTISFSSAGTMTDAVTTEIAGAPLAGTNATITNRMALRVYSGSSAAKGIVVRGAASQSANLQEWQDSSGAVLSAIGSNGAIQPATLTDAAAANNSIYYSSTAGKLVYKDSAGTVNNLY